VANRGTHQSDRNKAYGCWSQLDSKHDSSTTHPVTQSSLAPCNTWFAQQLPGPRGRRTCASLSLARTFPAVAAEARLALLLAADAPDTALIWLFAPLPGLPRAVTALATVPAMLPGLTLARGMPANEPLAAAGGGDDLSGWPASTGFRTVTASSCSSLLHSNNAVAVSVLSWSACHYNIMQLQISGCRDSTTVPGS